MLKKIFMVFIITIVTLFNNCVSTNILSLSKNVDVNILQNFEQKTNITALCKQMTINVPDTLELNYLTTDGKVSSYTSKYLHNIKPSFEGIFTEYISTKFNSIINKTNEKLEISINLKDYKISSRDISAKGEKFFAVMGVSADLKSEYSVELICCVKVEYNGEIYEKSFKVEENDQNHTKIKTSSISSFNSFTGYSKLHYSTTSSTNSLDSGISNCLNNVHIRVIINIDKMINDILNK